MKSIHACLFFVVGLVACQKQPAPNASVLKEAPAKIESAFQGAPDDLKANANQIKAAIESQNTPKAYVGLQTMMERPDISPQQRAAVSQSLVAVAQQLQAQAAAGDQAAAALLRMQRARK